MAERAEVLLVGAPRKLIVDQLAALVTLHVLAHAADSEALIAEVGPRVRAAAVTGAPDVLTAAVMTRLPRLELVASFGVGYDNIDIKYAAGHGITVTNTPEVLTEEVADTALGLLLCTVRELPQAERFLRAGKWLQQQYPLTRATLRDRTVGIVGMGRIGKAIARRLDAFLCPWSITPVARSRTCPTTLSSARRHGARRGHADTHHARGAGDQAPGRRGGARCARA